MAGTLRTSETQAAYDAVLAAKDPSAPCPLCAAETLHAFREWRIIANMFPYDRIAAVHHLLLPNRHVEEDEFTESEKEELRSIKDSYAAEQYQFFIEPVKGRKTVPGHMHLHLVVVKEQ